MGSPETPAWYRLVYRSRTKNQLESSRGRFHDDPEGTPTSYLAATIATAWKEVSARFGNVPGNPDAFRLYKVRVDDSHLADLTLQEVRERRRVSEDELRSDPASPRCREVAAALRAEGFDGAVYGSVRDRPDGKCLVLFLENCQQRVSIEPAEDEWNDFKESL